MITDCPDPSEVTDFHFLQLRTLRIAKSGNVGQNSRNLLAAASKYGLLFVGVEGGFNIIKLDNVLDQDEDKENRSVVENYCYDFVPSGTPLLLSVNANQTYLAVSVLNSSKVAIHLYSLSSYHGLGNAWQPFCTSALSVAIRDLVWNPTIEGVYAICFSDGSLQIHDVSGMSIAVTANIQGSNVVAVCWSPKGKQLVAGKENGTFTQYKPNLAEVKTIPPPPLDDSSPTSVASICWISNTLFAVTYVVADSPSLFIISTPKDSPRVYTNFYDVCLGNNSTPHQRYLMHWESSWNILVCASLDSIEIAVLGAMPNWVQWDLKEDGKALLPGKDGASNAVGMTVMYSAQRELVINESESYPPMPVLFLLTDNGLLVSFHMINSNPSAASLVYAPLPLENSGVHSASTPSMQPVPSTSHQTPFMSTTFIKGNQAGGDQTVVQKDKEVGNITTTPTFGKLDNSSISAVGQTKEKSIGDIKKPDSISFNPVQQNPVNYARENTTLSSTEKQNEVQTSSQSSYMSAILSEIQNFVKELQDLKQLQCSTPAIDGEEDMAKLKTYSLNMHNFQKEILETMQSINTDIYTLKNVLLESFVLVEEAHCRERRRNDHSFITMLKDRALDPITAKRMKKMNQHYQYLSTQMREVNDRLDQDWIRLCSEKGRSNNLHISSTEAIYKTIVNNQKIIHNLKKKVEILMQKYEERKLTNTTKSASRSRYLNRPVQEDLSKLADEFLQVKIVHPEESEPIEVTKKLSSESQNVLKAFLKKSDVVTVRPTVVYCPSQSRLLSNALPSNDNSVLDHDLKKDASPNQISTPSKEKEVSQAVSLPYDAQTPQIASKLSFSFNKTPTQSSPIAPVYEDITPPDVNVTIPGDRIFSGNNVSGSLSSNEKISEQQIYQPSFKAPSSFESSTKSNIHQETGSSIKNILNSKFETTANVGGKPFSFNKTSSESVSSVSPSLFFSKTISSATEAPKAVQIASPNPLPVSNSFLSSSATSFSFLNSPGLTKDFHSTVPVSSAVATSAKNSFGQEMKHLSENAQFSQPETTIAQLSTNTKLPVSSSFGFNLQEAKSTNLSSPSLFNPPENKTSVFFSVPSDKKSDASSEKNNAEFFFQKLSDSSNKVNESALKTSVVSASQPIAASSEITIIPLTPSKNDSVDSKLSHSNQTTDAEKGVLDHSTSTTYNQTPLSLNQQKEITVTASGQPVANNKFPNFMVPSFSDSKQSVPSPDAAASKLPVITSVASTTISEIPQSNATLPVSSATVPTSSPVVSNVSVIPQSNVPTSNSAAPVPVLSAVTAVTTAGTTVLTQSATGTTTTSESSGTVSNATASTTESTVPAFGGKPAAPVFGQSSAEMPSFFGASNAFAGQTPVTQPSVFGQTAATSAFPATSGGFFSQVPSFGSTAATSTTTSSDVNNQASTFSFGKSTFGQTSGTFGLAKSFFGQAQTPPTPFTQAGTQPTSPASSFSFAQNSNNVFGQGSFFSGLGGKPNEENASKNVFGLSNNNKNTDTNSLFKNSSVTSFGAVNTGPFSSTGSFSSGGGSVAQAGFGAFQQNTTSPKTGSFGSTPSFGGAPAFGSPPAFGGSPSFGSGNAFSSPVFGQQQQQQQQQQVTSNFSNFANASSPTFGSLASQSPGGFGSSSPVSGFGTQAAIAQGFGSSPSQAAIAQGFGSSPVFGGGSSFGGQPTSFGSPGSPPSNSSAFTQWRN